MSLTFLSSSLFVFQLNRDECVSLSRPGCGIPENAGTTIPFRFIYSIPHSQSDIIRPFRFASTPYS